jgi:hypothetical protein
MKPVFFRISLILIAVMAGGGSLAAQQGGVAAGQPLRDEDAIAKIDAAVKLRTDSIAGYTVQELYSIYRNGEANPSAQVMVKTVYNRETGKEYTPVSATGSSMLRSLVIDKVLTTEKEMAKAVNHEKVAVTSANYEMHLHPEHEAINGRDCIVMDMKARRKESSLLNGKGWFDAGDYTLVRLAGSPAQNVSMFAGDVAGERNYGRIGGFSMAEHTEMKTHNFMLGNTVMKIDYSDYKIELDPKPQAAAAGGRPQS